MKVLAFYFLMLVFGTFAGVGWFNNRKIPSVMDVALRYTLFTLFTLFLLFYYVLFKVLHTASTVACMYVCLYAYIVMKD